MSMAKMGFGPLADGGRVVVVGGGPGGTATAIALKGLAQSLGRTIEVTLLEGKDFLDGQHFNQCAGVLSPPIIDLIETGLQLPFPHHLCQKMLTGYILHTSKRSIVLNGEAEPAVSLRRVEFDAYMLDAARQRGVKIMPARATSLEFFDDRVQVYTESVPLEAEVVVGAFGMDEGSAALFERSVGYHPPAALNSIVTKYHPGQEEMQLFGDYVHAFLPTSPRIEFGAVTPKANHLTINIAGTQVNAEQMKAFLSAPDVQSVLPCLEEAAHTNPMDLRFFKGRFPCGLAKNYTGDRYVMVGDAAGLVRPFKGKGVTSAIQTGRRAAQVILQTGISAQAFQTYHDLNRDITGDMLYGHSIRRLTILASRLGMMNAVVKAAAHNQPLRQALFDAVSAQRPYREVIRATLRPASVLAILKALLI
jgi:flavin-dependent dehydrogenase